MTQSELDERYERRDKMGWFMDFFMPFFIVALLMMFAAIAYRLDVVERKLKELEAVKEVK